MRAAVLLGLAVLAAGCGGGGSGLVAGPPADRPGPVVTDVAIGGAETLGAGADDPVTSSWPQLLFHTTLARGAVLVDLAQPGATVAAALDDQVPRAVSLGPQLATVWLGLDDLAAGTPVAQYESRLDLLVHQLRRNGRTPVLLGGLPALPAGNALDAGRAGYVAAVRAVAAKEAATFVDLSGVTVQPGVGGRFRGPAGLGLDQAGHAGAAAAFGAAARRVLPAAALSRA